MPILQLGLESPTHSIIDKSLGCLPTILAILDFTTIKNELFPVVAAVFSKTSSLGIKIRALEAFVIFCGGSQTEVGEFDDGLGGAMIGANTTKPNTSVILDKYTVQEKIVPLLKAIKTKEPAVMMAALGVFKQVGKIADGEFLAFDVLPMIWSFSLGPLLNLEQFQEFMSLIKTLSSKIEQEQTRKLRELSSHSNGISANSRSTDLMGTSASHGIYDSNGAAGDVGETDFERLVLGKPTGKADAMLGDTLRHQPQRAQSEAPVFSWSTPTLTPAPHSTRAITPDHSLAAFAALTPSSHTTHTHPSLTSLAPPPSTSPWSFSLTPTPSIPSPPQPQSHFQHSAFSLPPPPMHQTSLSNLSIAPPTSQPQQRSYSQPQYGAGLAGASQGVGSKQPGKKGLDAYESLL